MIRLEDFGATMKRQCAAYDGAHSSTEYQPMRTFYDQCGTLTQNAYLSCRQEYLRHEIFNPIPRLTFISAASPYDLDIATLPPRKRLKLDTEIYDPDKARTSSIVVMFFIPINGSTQKKRQKIRWRFRMPMVSF